MPIIQIKLSAPRSTELSARVAARVSTLTTSLLSKPAGLISIAIDYQDPAHWFVGGPAIAGQGKTTFFLDIKITDETNTREEKARYVDAVFDAMAELIGPLHQESYIHVHDVRAEAYGYGGRTQAARYHAARSGG